MALPLSQGSNPEVAIVPGDQWTKICSSVKLAKITNMFSASIIVWLTYIKNGDPAPIGLLGPKWKMPAMSARFEDAVTNRDIYIYPQGSDVEIRVET